MSFSDWVQQYNKAFVGIIMVAVYLVNKKYGIELPIDDETALAILGMIISAVTYAVPNKKIEPPSTPVVSTDPVDPTTLAKG